MLGKQELGRRLPFRIDLAKLFGKQALLKQLLLEPQRQGVAERREASRREREIRFEQALELLSIAGRLKHKPPDNLVVYDLFLRAQQLEYEFTEESLLAALHHLKQALAIDPNYAPALALSAYCYAERRNQGWAEDLETEATEGLRLVARATELGTDDSTVMWMAARAVWHLAHDAQRARELGNRSLHLNPNSAIALAITAWAEVHFGNAEKSIELCVRAERLNPRDPRGWMIATSLGIAYFAQRRFEQAASSKRASYAALTPIVSALGAVPRQRLAEFRKGPG